jgi:hypothetical protein
VTTDVVGKRGIVAGREIAARPASDSSSGRDTRNIERPFDSVVGSPEHLRESFVRAAAAADRAVGLWLARAPGRVPDDVGRSTPHPALGELRALRALVRASATAYARRLRADGATPERMLVLVKTAAGASSSPGFGMQQLTNDIVRWSIEAYFDD